MSDSSRKNRIFEIVEVAKPKDTISRVFDIVIISLIIINALVVITDTFDIWESVRFSFFIIEVVSILIFTIEYICRIWTADKLYPHLSAARARRKYLFSFMALIDLIAILPFYLILLIPGVPAGATALRVVRIARLVRLFKMGRYTKSIHVIGSVLKSKASLLLSSMMVVGALMILASILMFYAENAAQPNAFANVFDAMWWSIITLTAVGYGDIFPITFLGRALASVIALLGISLFAIPTGIISAGFIEHINAQKKEQDDARAEEMAEELVEDLAEEIAKELKENKSKTAKEYCPYCGEKLD